MDVCLVNYISIIGTKMLFKTVSYINVIHLFSDEQNKARFLVVVGFLNNKNE